MKIFLTCLYLLSFASVANDKVNVLWLIVDDQGADWSVYGNKHVHTPNLRKLAKEAVVYNKAFAVSPICSPSHTSVFTGAYPTHLGCPHHRSNYIDALPDGFRQTEELFSEAGYFTVNLMSKEKGFDRIFYGASGKTDLNFNRGKGGGQSGTEVFDQVQIIDPLNSDTFFKGAAFAKKKPDQPFLAYVNLECGKAHGFSLSQKWAKKEGVSSLGKDFIIPPYFPQTGDVKKLYSKIYDSVSHTDYQIGRYIEQLKKEGYYDNTLIIIAGDHGYAIMRHKQSIYDSGLRVPMLIKYPKFMQKVGRENELVGLIDIAPTSLAVAGIKVEGIKYDGVDLSQDFKRQYIFGARDGAGGVFEMSRTVRDSRYRLIVNFYPELPYLGDSYAQRVLYRKEFRKALAKKANAVQARFLADSKPAIELYDLEKDPFEINNLAQSSEYQEVRKELRTALDNWMKDMGDEYLDLRNNSEPLKAGAKINYLKKKN